MDGGEAEQEELPDSHRYAAALLRVGPKLTDNHRALLIAHYAAPGHTATARELAAAIGSENFQSVNAQYGRLGTLLREALDYSGPGQKSYVIASFLSPGIEGRDEWAWIMHPQLADALETLGWVRKAGGVAQQGDEADER